MKSIIAPKFLIGLCSLIILVQLMIPVVVNQLHVNLNVQMLDLLQFVVVTVMIILLLLLAPVVLGSIIFLLVSRTTKKKEKEQLKRVARSSVVWFVSLLVCYFATTFASELLVPVSMSLGSPGV